MLIIRITMVTGLVLFGMSAWCQAQFTPGFAMPAGTTIELGDGEVPFMRQKLAIELAKTAAENGSQDLSLEVFSRYMENSTAEPIAPQTPGSRALQQMQQRSTQAGVQSSLLGSPGVDPFSGAQITSQIVTSRMTANVYADPNQFLPQIFELVQTWKKEHFDAERVSVALQNAVMPPSKPETVNLLAFGLRQADAARTVVPRTVTTTINTPNGPQTTTTTVYSAVATPPNSANPSFGQGGINTIQRFRSPNVVAALGLQMVDWATQAKRLDPLLAELKKRSASPEGQYAHALVVYALRSQGHPDQAAAHVDDLVEKNKLPSKYWEMVVQASMQPLAKDLKISSPANLNDLSIATETLPNDSRNRLLQHALTMDLIGTAPYFQHFIRSAIEAEDIKRINELVPNFVKQVEAASAANGGFNNPGGYNTAADNIWNEVIAECNRSNRPYMALKALRYVKERHLRKIRPAQRSMKLE